MPARAAASSHWPEEPSSPVTELVLRSGYRALLIVPLVGQDRVVGALVVRRKQPGEFPKNTIELLQTFAAHSVLAIQNARLFSEIEEKGRQLADASQHKFPLRGRQLETASLSFWIHLMPKGRPRRPSTGRPRQADEAIAFA
jgi:GAF domain-containing protein